MSPQLCVLCQGIEYLSHDPSHAWRGHSFDGALKREEALLWKLEWARVRELSRREAMIRTKTKRTQLWQAYSGAQEPACLVSSLAL